jgi:hypothetical protein
VCEGVVELLERVVYDLGIHLVKTLSDHLKGEDGPAPSYVYI